MPPDANADPATQPGSSTEVSDGFLVARVVGGDAAALSRLVERYDRLVRYTIFRGSRDRCHRDPHWLDSVASATWEGFARSLDRAPESRPRSVRAYLARIARNQCLTALRRASRDADSLSAGEIDGVALDVSVEMEEPVETLARLELLEALRGCLAELNSDDKMLATQLPAITERRWKDAAGALGLSESTVRSRWARSLERIRRCLERKIGKTFARGGFADD